MSYSVTRRFDRREGSSPLLVPQRVDSERDARDKKNQSLGALPSSILSSFSEGGSHPSSEKRVAIRGFARRSRLLHPTPKSGVVTPPSPKTPQLPSTPPQQKGSLLPPNSPEIDAEESLSLSSSSGKISLTKLLHGLPGLGESAPLSPRTPRSPSTPIERDIEEVCTLLAAFSIDFAKQTKTFRSALEKHKKSNSGRPSDEALYSLACSSFENLNTPFQTLNEKLKTLFYRVDQAGSPSSQRREWAVQGRLQNDLPWQAEPDRGTGRNPFSPQTYYDDLMRRARENPRLNIHWKHLNELLLKPRDGSGFPFNDSLVRLRQLSSEEQAKPHHLGFNYLARIVSIGTTLRQFKSQLLPNTAKDNSTNAATFMPEIERAVVAIDPAQKTETVDQYCDELGEFLTHYAAGMATALKSHLIDNQEIIPNYLSDYFPKINHHLAQRLIEENCLFSFEADFHRSQISGCISLSSDRHRISVPILDEAAREEKSDAYYDYQRALLIFFMDNLGIEERDPTPFHPVKRLDETHSIGQIYKEFEDAWSAQERPMRFEGIFKLLPLLRLFQQFILLAPHTGIIAMEKFLSEDLFAKIIGERPVGMPTKKIHFEFKDDRLTVRIWRQGALDQPIPQELHQRRRQAVFNHLLIASTVTFKASIHDMGNWETDTSFHVQQEAEHIDNFHPTFLQRYAELIVLLNVMGAPYTVERQGQSGSLEPHIS